MMMKLLSSVVILASLLNVTPGMANHPPRQVAQASSAYSIQGYCFSVANDDLDSTARIYIQGNQVTGRVEATIHNEQAAYYSSYTQTLQGTKKGNQLNLNITTKIELDTQKNSSNLDINRRFFEYGTRSLSKTTLFIVSNPVCTRS